MRDLRQATVGILAGGLLSLGSVGVVVAQTDTTARIDIGTVAQELELTEEKSRALAPLLETLNDVFERRQAHFQEGDEILEDLAEAYDQVAETLSAAELREFHLMLRETAIGPNYGRGMGGSMRSGRMGGAMNGGPAMRGGRGRGMYMRGGRGYAGQGMPMRGTRGFEGRGARPGWRFDDIDPNN